MTTVSINKRATFDYEILEKFTAGIELGGHEAKSVKMGRINLAGAHAIIRKNEVFLLGAEIPSFQPTNAPKNYDPGRTKKLLLKREEIKHILGKLQDGLSLIPLKIFINRGFVKIEIGLGRGLKKHDKRELIKKKTIEREMRRFEN